MGYATLYVETNRNLDEVKDEIEHLKKQKQTKQLIAVKKLMSDPNLDAALSQQNESKANIMVEFKLDKDTDLGALKQQVSGVKGVHIINTVESY